MIDRGYPQTLIENLLSDIYKVHREEVSGNNVRGQYYYLYPVSAEDVRNVTDMGTLFLRNKNSTRDLL